MIKYKQQYYVNSILVRCL